MRVDKEMLLNSFDVFQNLSIILYHSLRTYCVENNNLVNGIPSELALCTNLKLLLLGGNSDMNYDVPSELVNLLSTNQVTHGTFRLNNNV